MCSRIVTPRCVCTFFVFSVKLLCVSRSPGSALRAACCSVSKRIGSPRKPFGTSISFASAQRLFASVVSASMAGSVMRPALFRTP